MEKCHYCKLPKKMYRPPDKERLCGNRKCAAFGVPAAWQSAIKAPPKK